METVINSIMLICKEKHNSVEGESKYVGVKKIREGIYYIDLYTKSPNYVSKKISHVILQKCGNGHFYVTLANTQG